MELAPALPPLSPSQCCFYCVVTLSVRHLAQETLAKALASPEIARGRRHQGQEVCCSLGRLADHCLLVVRWKRSSDACAAITKSALKFVKVDTALFLRQGVNAIAAESDLNLDSLAD